MCFQPTELENLAMTDKEERAAFNKWYRETRGISQDQLFVDANSAALRLLFQAWLARANLQTI